MAKTKSKSRSKRPWWKWWTEKELTEEARDKVVSLPRYMGISRKQIALEMKREKKRIAKKWKDEEIISRNTPSASFEHPWGWDPVEQVHHYDHPDDDDY